MPSRVLLVVLAVATVLALPVAIPAKAAPPPYQHTPQAQATGTGGAAATVDSVATDAAIKALRSGGNAVDAAVTAAAVLGVTEPFSCGVGGGGFMVIRTPAGKVTTIDSRELAPAAMHPQSFWENGAPLPFNDARYSGLSAGVPGTVAGWDEALDRYGTFSLREALAPAIKVADHGFVVDQVFVDQITPNIPWFDDIPSTAALYLDPDGTARDVGSVVRNPDMAKTLEMIGRRGPRAFYRGAIADAIVQATTHPPTGPGADKTWRPGVMTADDLAGYVAPERKPTHVSHRGFDVYGMAPPSSGGSTDGEALNLLEGFDLPAVDQTQALHLFLEASRVSFADRNAWIADPSFFDVPLRGLLSDGYADTRRTLIDPDHAGTSPVAPGDPRPFDDSANVTGEAAATVTRAGTTTHITASDRRGTIVSFTTTIESFGGNAIVVPGYGFLLNNELTDFNYDSTTHPNRVEGGKRPRSSMAPTIVERDGEPVLATGSPGGSTIITTVLQILMNALDRGFSLPDAIAAPRASQRNTAATLAEPAFIASPEGQALASQYGHTFTNGGEIGAATGISWLGGDRIQAAAEPVRRGGGNAQVTNP